SLALIINELTTNTIKHGLVDRDIGHIMVHIEIDHQTGLKPRPQPNVQLQHPDSTIVLEFHDNGPGYPGPVLNLKQHNVGLYLVQSLVQKELKGEVMFHNNLGAVAAIRFKADESLFKPSLSSDNSGQFKAQP
ncbi:MAG: ATP-binding protein, partial [Chloroflexota bacterium]